MGFRKMVSKESTGDKALAKSHYFMKPHPSQLSEDHPILKEMYQGIASYMAIFEDVADISEKVSAVLLKYYPDRDLISQELCQTDESSDEDEADL